MQSGEVWKGKAMNIKICPTKEYVLIEVRKDKGFWYEGIGDIKIPNSLVPDLVSQLQSHLLQQAAGLPVLCTVCGCEINGEHNNHCQFK